MAIAKFTITAVLYQVGTVEYGWQLVGTIPREATIDSVYESDESLLSMLKIGSLHEYRLMLEDAGATVVQNNITCFPTQTSAESVISKLTSLVNKEMLYCKSVDVIKP